MWLYGPLLLGGLDGVPGVDLGATEASDTASLAVNSTVAVAATEASDTAALAVNSTVALAASEASDTAAAQVLEYATLAATESADTAAFDVTLSVADPVDLAATEASDSASFAVNSTAALAGTEGSDTASLAVNSTVALAATEGSDTASFNVAFTVQLAAVEGADTVSFSISETAVLQVTEEADTASFNVSPQGAFDLGATEESDTFSGTLDFVAPTSGKGGSAGGTARIIPAARTSSVTKSLRWIQQVDEFDTETKREIAVLAKSVDQEDDLTLEFREKIQGLMDRLYQLQQTEVAIQLRSRLDTALRLVADKQTELERKRLQDEEDWELVVAALEVF